MKALSLSELENISGGRVIWNSDAAWKGAAIGGFMGGAPGALVGGYIGGTFFQASVFEVIDFEVIDKEEM